MDCRLEFLDDGLEIKQYKGNFMQYQRLSMVSLTIPSKRVMNPKTFQVQNDNRFIDAIVSSAQCTIFNFGGTFLDFNFETE